MKKRKVIIIISSIALTLALLVWGIIYIFFSYLPERRESEERERLIREYYENKLTLYGEENERYADFEVEVAFLGDSLTDGYDLAHYYPDYTVANRGIGGETSYGLLERMEISLYALKPQAAVILIGGNNLETALVDYENIILGARENSPETKLIFASLTAMGGAFSEKNKIAAYNNAVIKKLCEKHGVAFVDLFTPLLDAESGEICADYTTDGVHLTPLGYEVLTAAIEPAIRQALGK